MMATLAACNTKQAGKAKTYYGAVGANTKTMLRQQCLKQNIELAE